MQKNVLSRIFFGKNSFVKQKSLSSDSTFDDVSLDFTDKQFINAQEVIFLPICPSCENILDDTHSSIQTCSKLFYSLEHQLGPLGWVGHRVAMSVCLCVCMSVIKVVIVNNGQKFQFLSFLFK